MSVIAAGSIDPREAEQFAALADQWWDPDGAFRPLHRLGPVRMGFIADMVSAHLGRPRGIGQLDGLQALDVGCGGGLATEPLARLGAQTLGIDVTNKNIEAAKSHAESSGLKIDYELDTAENLASKNRTFDLVIALEVVEHVPEPDVFLRAIATLTRPGGLLITSTINRTPKALLLAKFTAEYVVRWLPRGTHNWRKFLKPSELARPLREEGLIVHKPEGVSYDLFTDDWKRSKDLSMNYMIAATRPES
ncbi:MAG: bifunctional 2-polyprenyl-6-hydroxyphenol methylase/3-demethylubiquinol 3-O-methyltransferase UbiG [Rhodospirillales bacterium]